MNPGISSYYQSPSQLISPVKNFISSLSLDAQAKVVLGLKLLEQYGIKAGPPHVKKLTGTQLWELRILGNDNIRILYVAVVNRNFLLLHGFNKKKQKTDRKEIKTAESRLDEYHSRNK
jgi:phage-related protein